MKTIGIAILTLNAEKHLSHCIANLRNSTLNPKILVVDSSSKDQTCQIAKSMGVEILAIRREEFNHGATREMARKHLNTDIVVMVTPDAYAIDNNVLEVLVRPILENAAEAAYGRQIPHNPSNFFESFPREFNYPASSHIRTIEDVNIFGVYTFFCSNSFAAYSNQALDKIGGFKSVLLGEDTVAIAELLHQRGRVAYVAEAVVKHSHQYSLKQEFRRHFDTGYSRSQYKALFSNQKDRSRGKKYVIMMIKRLIKTRPTLLPYAFLQCATKWIGYQLGTYAKKMPLFLKKKCSSFPGYWSSSYYSSQE